jgi:glucose-1-phosphate cytidylyltransferase
MKVVLFCGGMGMRLREYSESIPKPMVPVGDRPILWHLMKYYAHFGHKDFVLCLGWKGNVIKDYFLNYNECVSNDFVLSDGKQVELLNSDIHDWRITFVDTGLTSNIGQRLMAVKDHLAGEEMFLANYADGVSDVHLPDMVDFFHENNSLATCIGVSPKQSFHLMHADEGVVTDVTPVCDFGLCMNGGFFVLSTAIFDYMNSGEELVCEPFQRLIQQRRLTTYKHNGFWGCMDTYKEKQLLDEMHKHGDAPWQVWNQPITAEAPTPPNPLPIPYVPPSVNPTGPFDPLTI